MHLTFDLMAAFGQCRYKALLKCSGEVGIPNEYEKLQRELTNGYRSRATKWLVQHFSLGEVVSSPPSLDDALRSRPRLILDAPSIGEHRSVVFPAIERATPNTAKKHEYVPLFLYPNAKLSLKQKNIAALLGTTLSSWHALSVPFAKIVHGPDFSITKLMFRGSDGPTRLAKESAAVLHDLEALVTEPTPPAMYLNDHCATCEYRDRCRKDAVARDDLSLLRGLQPKEIEAWKKRGIFTVTQLAYTFRAKTMGRSSQEPKRHSQPLQAMAIRDSKTYVRKRPEMPSQSTKVFFDVEGIPERTFFYLIGVILVKDGTATSHHFWADDESQQQAMWRSFVGLLTGLADYVLVHFGRYEKDFIREMHRRYGVTEHDPASRLFDVHAAIRTNVYFPVYSNGLKDIATFLGFQWQGPIRSGVDSIVWRYRWEKARQRSQKDALRRYNYQDCLAVMTVFDQLAAVAQEHSDQGILVEHTVSLPGRQQPRFGQPEYAIPFLKRMVKSAYFNYQQEKVFFRADKHVRRTVIRKRRASEASVKVNHTELCHGRPSTCPKCGSARIRRTVSDHAKIVKDLKLFRGGIKRWVVKYLTARYECSSCRSSRYALDFPTDHPLLGHGTAGWIVYQHIAGGQSFAALQENLEELFGYSLGHMIVRNAWLRLAARYAKTEELLLSRLRSGHLICADETKVAIRANPGYVWAFSGPETVIYRFSLSRDGTVLNAVLGGFTGVLVSDYYGVYDSVKCLQQKCLVHLVRDINDDLLKSPFDEELKGIASRFTSLMTAVVETIDRYGLAKRHLAKFIKESERFCKWVAGQHFTSKVAEGYQKRIGKYGGRLFTFLSHDGVPWNNNLAENAVKLIASRRRFIDGLMSKDGIKDYLIFLSIYQTLRRKGGSFLRFLLSGETDVFRFLDE